MDKKAVDFVVRNEGEYKMLDLVRALDSGGDFSKIGGIGWKRDDGTMVPNPETVVSDGSGTVSVLEKLVSIGDGKKKSLIEELDGVPFPARDLTDKDLYRNLYTGERYTFLVTSRGCPAACTYCDSKVTFGRKTRFRSARNVVDEIKQVGEQFGITQFTITDDTFTLNKRRTLELCQLIIDENLDIKYYLGECADE